MYCLFIFGIPLTISHSTSGRHIECDSACDRENSADYAIGEIVSFDGDALLVMREDENIYRIPPIVTEELDVGAFYPSALKEMLVRSLDFAVRQFRHSFQDAWSDIHDEFLFAELADADLVGESFDTMLRLGAGLQEAMIRHGVTEDVQAKALHPFRELSTFFVDPHEGAPSVYAHVVMWFSNGLRSEIDRDLILSELETRRFEESIDLSALAVIAPFSEDFEIPKDVENVGSLIPLLKEFRNRHLLLLGRSSVFGFFEQGFQARGDLELAKSVKVSTDLDFDIKATDLFRLAESLQGAAAVAVQVDNHWYLLTPDEFRSVLGERGIPSIFQGKVVVRDPLDPIVKIVGKNSEDVAALSLLGITWTDEASFLSRHNSCRVRVRKERTEVENVGSHFVIDVHQPASGFCDTFDYKFKSCSPTLEGVVECVERALVRVNFGELHTCTARELSTVKGRIRQVFTGGVFENVMNIVRL